MTGKQQFPKLELESVGPTRDALHAYARVLGDWLKTCRPKRKHWWHASLRPSLTGLTSGVVNAEIDFELELNLRDSLLSARTSEGAQLSEGLNGQSAADFAQVIDDFLLDSGIDSGDVPAGEPRGGDRFAGNSADHANSLGQVLTAVNAAMAEFRSGIKEETSPIQLWPHHFDLSMLWLPGEKIEGQDPDNEEYSDKQMNFGFAFGDEGIPEPYFYVTAYPLPDELPSLKLPTGTEWRTEGFSGAVLLYETLIKSSDPHGYLLDLWAGLLLAGRDQMLSE
jgi:hypothetical protein